MKKNNIVQEEKTNNFEHMNLYSNTDSYEFDEKNLQIKTLQMLENELLAKLLVTEKEMKLLIKQRSKRKNNR